MSGAVEMAESFLVTSWESFLSRPITVTLDFLRVLVPEPEARLRQESGCREDILIQCHKCYEETEKCNIATMRQMRHSERVTASGNQFLVNGRH